MPSSAHSAAGGVGTEAAADAGAINGPPFLNRVHPYDRIAFTNHINAGYDNAGTTAAAMAAPAPAAAPGGAVRSDVPIF